MARLGDVILAPGLLADRPAASIEGRLYYASDARILYRDSGTVWEEMMTAFGMIDSGWLSLVGADQQVDQNKYGASVEFSFGAEVSGYLSLQALVSAKEGTGAVQKPRGVVLVFDSDPSIAANDAALSIATHEKELGQWTCESSDWVNSDANAAGATPYLKDAIRIDGLSSVWIAWQHLSATSYNDAAGDDETLQARLVLDRSK